MSQQNLDNTKKAYAAFAAADIDGATENMADSIEWVVPGNSAVSGTYRGKDEVVGFFIKLAEKSFATEPQAFLADGNTVVALTKVSADGETSDAADVLTFNDEGKVTQFKVIGDTAQQERIWGTK